MTTSVETPEPENEPTLPSYLADVSMDDIASEGCAEKEEAMHFLGMRKTEFDEAVFTGLVFSMKRPGVRKRVYPRRALKLLAAHLLRETFSGKDGG